MVGVYVSSHRKLIGHIGCCCSPQLQPSPLVVRILAEACSLRIIRCLSFGSHVHCRRSWALIRVLRSARPGTVRLTWLLSPQLARATNDRPAVMFQPSDSYTCSTIPLEHRLHVSSQLGTGGRGQWLRKWVGPTAPRRGNMRARRV